MFEQAFKNIDDVLRKEAGCTTELDYTEQTSWLLFLKYLEDLEQDRATVAWCPRFASVFDANLGQHIPTRLPGYRPKNGREPGAPGK